MFCKFMIELMCYWVEEYYIDGFCVDFMGIYDIEMMNVVVCELYSIDFIIFIYGEGWKVGDSFLFDD